MYGITEHGMLLQYNTEEEFSIAKDKIDRFAKKIQDNLYEHSAMHFVTLPTPKRELLLSCLLVKGAVRFGLYNSETGVLSRYIDTTIVDLLDETTTNLMVSRLLFAAQNQLSLPPLNDLWELSVQKELAFMDAYGFVELKDPTVLDTSIEALQGKENIEKE